MSISADVFFADEVLDVGAAGYGVLMTAWMLGMVGGAAALARRIPPGAHAVAALAGIAVQGAGLLGAALGATFATALAGFLVGGVAHGVKNVLLRTLIHERVPEAERGRAFAGYNALRNGAELGALAAGGALVGFAGPQIALALSGAIPLVIGVAALGLRARLGGRDAVEAPVGLGRRSGAAEELAQAAAEPLDRADGDGAQDDRAVGVA
jgi:MFS family permease